MLRHVVLYLASVMLTAMVTLIPSASASTQEISIPTFDVDYYLSRDAQNFAHIRVHEHIAAMLPQLDQTIGVVRDIPTVQNGQPIQLQIQSITDDTGQALEYRQEALSNYSHVVIGHQGTFVHGLSGYNLEYTVDNITPAMNGSTFMWDTLGARWTQPIGQAVARLHLTSDLLSRLKSPAGVCNTGPFGTTAHDCITNSKPEPPDSLFNFVATRQLEAGETLGIGLSFLPETFANPTTKGASVSVMTKVFIITFFSCVVLVLVYLYRRRFKTRVS
jgi:hypothetical protein